MRCLLASCEKVPAARRVKDEGTEGNNNHQRGRYDRRSDHSPSPLLDTPCGILHPHRTGVLSFPLLSGCHGAAIPFLSAARVTPARRLTPGAGRARCERRRQKCRRKPPRSSSTLCIDPLPSRGVGFFLAQFAVEPATEPCRRSGKQISAMLSCVVARRDSW